MPAKVILRVVRGSLESQQFVFDERDSCIAGRGADCRPRLPNGSAHATVSRHHCLLDVNPPDIRIRDFGSLNGTYVNGQKIGQRAPGQTPDEGGQIAFPEYDLKNGDEICLGETVLRVCVEQPIQCVNCEQEMAADTGAAPDGSGRCQACRVAAAGNAATVSASAPGKRCSCCGAEVRRQPGSDRPGALLCARCRGNPHAVADALLKSAAAGDKALASLCGYRIVRELGRGGMGAVFLAQHSVSATQVALKVMLPQIAAKEHACTRFLREIDNMRALRHPHIVQLLENGEAQGAFFFTLEYCAGGSISSRMAGSGPLSVDDAVTLALQALDGLDYSHNLFGPGQGVVHRDLKPANLLLTGADAGGRAKIADFGLSKAFDQAGLSGQTRTGACAGTPLCMPRQQVIDFKYARPEVDVWALAASLYYMLTGAYPRDFPPRTDPWLVVLRSAAIPIRERQPALPPRLAEVIDQALVDQPRIVFQTALQLKDALQSAL